MKIATKTKVALKTTLSKPLRVKETFPVRDLPKPFPFVWANIARIKRIDTRI